MLGSTDFRAWCATVLAAVSCSPAFAPAADKDLAPLAAGQWVFVGKVTAAKAGPVALSNPPIHNFRLSFEATETLRGKKPDAKEFAFRAQQKDAPTFPADQSFLVAVKQQEKDWVVAYLGPADKDAVEKAKALLALPVGWTIEDGKPVSPWAGLKTRAWPEGAPKSAGPACSKSGRPALLAGDAVEMTVEQVLPEKIDKFKNPYGDGQFKVTVRNTSDKPVEVPALLTDGKTVFWEDSVLVLHKAEPLLLGGAGKATAAKPVQLKPGEAVTGVIDTLAVEGLDWPRGGARVYFDFALGEKTATNFFYYFSTLHDPMRDAARKKAFDK